MFKSAQHYRTFLTVLLTYTLDLVGYSIVFPVLAPLLLDTQLHFFSPETAVATRTTVLGLIFAAFGIMQFIGAPITGTIADHYGRSKAFLWTIAISVFGYSLMAYSVYEQNLSLLFLGRIVTGICSGNAALAQSATADLTDVRHRSRAFGILIGVGGLGFVIGPWIGGKLANPEWLSGAGAFIFAAIAALINFFVVLFFFVETWKTKDTHENKTGFIQAFKDIRLVFHHKMLRSILMTFLLFSIGWCFFLIFSPTFLVQRFQLGPDKIGDIFAYMAIVWFFVSMFLNKELVGKFSMANLTRFGMVVAVGGFFFFVFSPSLWLFWFAIPVALTGGCLAWVNINALVSTKAPENMQGRAMGATGSLWSIGQIIAPLVAGPLAGWDIFSPILVGSMFIILAFGYFLFRYREVS